MSKLKQDVENDFAALTPKNYYDTGVSFETGRKNTPKDILKAINCYRESLDKGSDLALMRLVNIYLTDERHHNTNEAVRLLRKYANAGNLAAQKKLIGILAQDPKNHGLEIYKYADMSAKQGDAESIVNYAKCFLVGIGIEKNEKNTQHGVKLLSEAEKNGNIYAFALLGRCYLFGAKPFKKDEKLAIEHLSKAAEKGNMEAQAELGNCFYKGIAVERDINLAFKYFTMAADQGCNQSMDALKIINQSFLVSQDDYRKTIQTLKQAAERNVPEAYNILGICCFLGLGVTLDLPEAKKLFETAIEKGCLEAKYNLAWLNIIEYGRTDLKLDWVKGIRLLHDAACKQPINTDPSYVGLRYLKNLIITIPYDQLHVNYMLGIAYLRGLGVIPNPKLAVYYLNKSATLFRESRLELAHCYEQGVGVRRNYKKAFSLYKRMLKEKNDDLEVLCKIAIHFLKGLGIEPTSKFPLKDMQKLAITILEVLALNGYTTAYTYLGLCYEQGLGEFKQDDKEAVEYYRRADKYNCPLGQLYLGWCYEQGKGVSRSSKLAFEMYQSAAYLRNADAINNLAVCYELGEGVKACAKKAYELYCTAVKYGNTKAYYNVARCFEQGIGVEKNIEVSKQWYQAASDAGDLEARQYLKTLKEFEDNNISRRLKMGVSGA